ncbi:MAG: hypothetical protein FWC11_01400 [Firmicutes bacterium]|nr:hypothetical protein [Bacillota bacterium]
MTKTKKITITLGLLAFVVALIIAISAFHGVVFANAHDDCCTPLTEPVQNEICFACKLTQNFIEGSSLPSSQSNIPALNYYSILTISLPCQNEIAKSPISLKVRLNN